MVLAPVSVPPGSLVAGRYRVERPLGRGGMGSVYAATDLSSGRVVALKCLKRLSVRAAGAEFVLFQREFHVLAHLTHPCVIRVLDYGVDQGRPYYTMELLDGSDLRELAPMPWRRACRVLRDIASSLGLLHSRRLLHRDLSPRNVRCTSDGRAKLLDFGTMAPMGVPRDIAGTAPYVPPEALHGQALDARSELFSLGALAYWVMTGRNAYPARELQDLGQAWSRTPAPPSQFVGDIPEELDQLVLTLLSLDPAGRASHVAEVIDRLTAVADLEPVERPEVASAYLTAPTLVGHSERVASFQKRLVRAARGRGSSVVIRGQGGAGRSRLLQTFTLEAKLCGVQVTAVDAKQAGRGEFAVMRALLQRLSESAPSLALESFASQAAVLGRFCPDLHAKLETPPPLASWGGPSEELAAVLSAMCAVFLAASAQRPLVLAVDDVDYADEWSVACLATLAGEARIEHFVLVTTAERSSESNPLDRLLLESAILDLPDLDPQQIRGLVGSIFGEVPHLRVVAEWVAGLAGGSPRTAMELAEYLVDEHIVRYERGGWTLPESLQQDDLPVSVEQTEDRRIAALSGSARALAEAMALVTQYGALALDELVAFAGAERADETHAALGELIAAQIVGVAGSVHALRHRGLAARLKKSLELGQKRSMHLRLAAVYLARLPKGLELESIDSERERAAHLLAAYHRHQGDDLAGCWQILSHVDFAESAWGRTPEAIAMYEAALAYGERARLPPHRLFKLRKALIKLSSTADPSLIRYAEPTLAQLCRDSGRIYFEGLAAEPDPQARIRACVRLARKRYDETDVALRGLEPAEASFELGACALALTESYVVRNDVEGLSALPALLQPFGPHAPVFELLQELAQLALGSLRGQAMTPSQHTALARLELPLPGIDASSQDAIRNVWTYWAGMDDAMLGKDRALARAIELEQKAFYAPLAAQVRSIYYLFQGNEAEADVWHKRRELLALQTPSSALTAARGALYEGWGYFLCGSVLGLRRVIAAVSKLVTRFPGWQAELCVLEGLCEILRGEWGKAHALVSPSDAAAGAQCLLALGRGDEACALTERLIAAPDFARRHPLVTLRLHTARALALAEQGETERAAHGLDSEIISAEAAGISGVLLAGMYEARARLAIATDDHALFVKCLGRIHGVYARGAAGLRARHEQLAQLARHANVSLPPPVAPSLPPDASPPGLQGLADPALNVQERVEQALHMLAVQARCSEVFFYSLQRSGLRFAGRHGPELPPEGLDDLLAFYLSAEVDPKETGVALASVHGRGPADMIAWITDGVALYYPVVLSTVQENKRLIAGIAAFRMPTQREPRLSHELTSQIAQTLLAAGDMPGVVAPL